MIDGKTNRYESHLPYAAPALKAAGVQVYSVGIGSIDIAELQLISSDPDDEHVFILSSFRDAAGFVDFLSVTTCESEFIYISTYKMWHFGPCNLKKYVPSYFTTVHNLGFCG